MGKRQRTRRRADADPPVWFGAVFVLAGGVIAALGAGWIPIDPASVHAPGWVIMLVGAVFALGGAMCYTHGLGPNFDDGLALLMLVSFAMVGSWIAFGPGEREFSGGGSVGGVGVSGRVGSGFGRVVFGFGALMVWTVAAAVLARLVKRLAGSD